MGKVVLEFSERRRLLVVLPCLSSRWLTKRLECWYSIFPTITSSDWNNLSLYYMNSLAFGYKLRKNQGQGIAFRKIWGEYKGKSNCTLIDENARNLLTVCPLWAKLGGMCFDIKVLEMIIFCIQMITHKNAILSSC